METEPPVASLWSHWIMATGITVLGGWFLQAFEIQLTREKFGLLELPWCSQKVIAEVRGGEKQELEAASGPRSEGLTCRFLGTSAPGLFFFTNSQAAK